ncbi:MAG: hypothetical protein KGZ40_01940 [Clostridiales bacterium]|nr:hypothetical protein [Clostridiales bacterium]
MKISREQVGHAARYLQTSSGARDTQASREISPQLLERLQKHLESLPDYREDRIESARMLIEGPLPPPQVIAESMLGRIISDSIR